MIKTCYVCNKQFDAKPSNKKICDACRNRILNAVQHHKPGVCTVCGKKFKPFKPTNYYCSDRCSRIANQVTTNYRKVSDRNHIPRKKKRVVNKRSLDELALAARQCGMDYGTYTAVLRMKGIL